MSSIELQGDLLPKQDHHWSPQWRCLPFLSLHAKESGSTSILRNIIMIASWCQNPWSDCCGMINQFLGKMTEQYDLMISWKNSRRKSSMVLCNGQLAIGYLSWRKEEGQRKGFNIVWTWLLQTLPVAMETSSCFSAWWFLRISSVSSEQ